MENYRESAKPEKPQCQVLNGCQCEEYCADKGSCLAEELEKALLTDSLSKIRKFSDEQQKQEHK